MCPFDLGIYIFLHLRADWKTGIFFGCALTIAYRFGDPAAKAQVQRSLRRLRDRNYINYRNGDGKKNGYPILINKYSVRVGQHLGTRLNAWKYNGLVKPEYEAENGATTAVAHSKNSANAVMPPNQDFKTLQDKTPNGVRTFIISEAEATARDVWTQVKANMQPQMNKHSFDTWFQPTHGQRVEGDRLFVSIPTADFQHIGTKYIDLIQPIIEEFGYHEVVFTPCEGR